MYKRGTQELIDDDVDKEKLDELARNNPMIKDKQLSLMLNSLRKVANMFPYYNEAKVHLMGERLQNQGYGVVPLEKALEKILDRSDTFPTYKVLLDMVRSCTPKSRQKEDNTESVKDNEKFLHLKSEFIRILGEDKIDAYSEWWVKEVLGADVRSMGFTYNVFLRCALFDWFDSGFSNDFNKIREIGLRKQEIIRKNKNTT